MRGLTENKVVQQLAEQVHRTILLILDHPYANVEQGDLDLLSRFSELAGSSPLFKAASEKVRSLVSLLTHREGQFLDDQIYVQILAIGQSIVDAIHPDGAPPGSMSLSPLVTPVPPSEERLNNDLAIYVDRPATFHLLQEAAEKAGFVTRQLHCLSDISEFDEDSCPAAIIAELNLFQLDPNAMAVLNGLRHRVLQPPHLFLMAKPDDIAARFEAVRLGATRFVSMPPDVGRLMSILKGVTLKNVSKPYRALLIDDDRLLCKAHELALNKAGIETLALSDPLQVPFQVARFQPDVIVSDIFMQGCNGLELLAVLRQDDSLADTPIILLTSESEPRRRIEALELGGDDFLSKPVSIPLFISTVIAQAKRSRRLKRSRHDLHELFSQIRHADHSISGSEPHARMTEIQEILLPPNLIPPEDYVVSESPGALPAPG